MQLIPEAHDMSAYLAESAVIDFSHPLVRAAVLQLERGEEPETTRVRRTFEFVRDEVHHSCDIESHRVTCAASEVLAHREGLCYAKSHLLAALLRAQGIPTGFCYQRLTKGETPETGFVVHGLNGVYLASVGRWIRLDARGNKPGVQAEYSVDRERLAYPVRPELGERDYPTIYAAPALVVLDALYGCEDLYERELPSEL